MEALELYKEESAKVKAHQELCHKKGKQVLQTRTMYIYPMLPSHDISKNTAFFIHSHPL